MQPLAGRAIVIAGPTASGKSQLAAALAERLGGVIINADSMQVYRDLEVLTARPQRGELARLPHALYGFVSGQEAYSAGRYGGMRRPRSQRPGGPSVSPSSSGALVFICAPYCKASRPCPAPIRRCGPTGGNKRGNARRGSCTRSWRRATRSWPPG